MTEKLPSYGGQAVIEGVMMRGTQAMAIAVRDPKGQIQLHTRPLGSLYRGRLSKIPFLRGLLGLWDALGLGMQSLQYSASVAAGEDVKVEGPAMWVMVLISLSLGIGLYLLAPAAAGAGVDYLM